MDPLACGNRSLHGNIPWRCTNRPDSRQNLRSGTARRTIGRLEHGKAVSIVVAMDAIRVLGRDVALVPRFAKLQVKA
ncbi:hypothetical protein [Arthrobacter sp. MA-N2]|uniref:hypothetical protein n=1 Tax=Arthrobacter sp. MA-N2 TaxID=1101188 RepID=UPI000483708B|nr:hypothetical protein [Arthrobacter sp. MA-N2]